MSKTISNFPENFFSILMRINFIDFIMRFEILFITLNCKNFRYFISSHGNINLWFETRITCESHPIDLKHNFNYKFRDRKTFERTKSNYKMSLGVQSCREYKKVNESSITSQKRKLLWNWNSISHETVNQKYNSFIS